MLGSQLLWQFQVVGGVESVPNALEGVRQREVHDDGEDVGSLSSSVPELNQSVVLLGGGVVGEMLGLGLLEGGSSGLELSAVPDGGQGVELLHYSLTNIDGLKSILLVVATRIISGVNWDGNFRNL